jgi:uncharacterized protein YndB with AHSA1/START domain
MTTTSTTSRNEGATRAGTAGALNAKVAVSGERTLHFERIFDAPRERLWRALTEKDLLAQWWGRGNRLTVERYELRRGGHWRFVEHTTGGDQGFEGRFREITPPTKLETTFEWDGQPGHVIVQTMGLEALPDGRTKLVGDCLFLTPEDRDGMVSSGMEAGMNASYAALDRVLAVLGR